MKQDYFVPFCFLKESWMSRNLDTFFGPGLTFLNISKFSVFLFLSYFHVHVGCIFLIIFLFSLSCTFVSSVVLIPPSDHAGKLIELKSFTIPLLHLCNENQYSKVSCSRTHGYSQDSNPHCGDVAIRTPLWCTKLLGHGNMFGSDQCLALMPVPSH